jgi:hypothetical protein
MHIRFRYLMAAAAEPDCLTIGGSTTCSTPGNVEINSSPPVDFTLPYWDETFGDTGYYPGPYPVPYDEGSGDLGSPAHR